MTLPGPAWAEITGKPRIIDGDRIEIAGQRIRLHGIDALEAAQRCVTDNTHWPCGGNATHALSGIIGTNLVTCRERRKDPAGGVVAICTIAGPQGTDVAAMMVASRWALADRRVATDYVTDEAGARRKRQGVWREKFIRPWDWRRGIRLSARDSQPGACLIKGDIVLLDERHDNPDHHLLQARLVRAVIRHGRRPAIVFEMISEDRQPAIDRWLSQHPGDAAGLGGAVGWDASGWPPCEIYRPIADAARPVRAGLSALDPARRTCLGLDDPPSQRLAALLRRDLFDAHCGLIPEISTDPLVDVQRTRDAVMADNIATAFGLAGTDSAVLIAGAVNRHLHLCRGRR